MVTPGQSGLLWMSANVSPAEHVHLDEFSVSDGKRLDFGPLPGTPPHPTESHFRNIPFPSPSLYEGSPKPQTLL